MRVSKRKEYSSAKHSDSVDMDPLSTSIIEELLDVWVFGYCSHKNSGLIRIRL